MYFSMLKVASKLVGSPRPITELLLTIVRSRLRLLR